jgi:hypothetical protein
MRYTGLCGIVVAAVMLLGTQEGNAVDKWGLKPGAVDLKSSGPLAFGPDGILFVGDPTAASVVAIATDDAKSGPSKASINIQGFQEKLAALLETGADQVRVADMAVNPASRNIYMSVTQGPQGQPGKASLVKISIDGKLSKVALDKVNHSKAELAGAPDANAKDRRGRSPRAESITDLAFVDGKVFVTGKAAGAAPSKVRELAFPFADSEAGTSIEIWHAAHGRMEDDAVVRTFAPLVIDGEPMLLAGFTCTPLVKFPISGLESGKKVRGTTVAELGNQNQPLDMIVYTKDGKDFLLMSNTRRGVMKISTDRIRENAGLTEPVPGGGTAGQPFETIKELSGVQQLDRLDDERAVILAQAGSSLDLKTIELP